MIRARSFWLILLTLAACQQQPVVGPAKDVKVGKPYVIGGKTYYPEYDPTYDKVGMGSWYGPGFHGKYTASGETFNQNDLTAAHPTLPMPTLVRVTNLKNGRSVIVRINDRGPFKANRIIDLSKGSAESIGMKVTTQVRVQYLKKETEDYLASLHGGDPFSLAAVNDRAEKARDNAILQSTEPAGSQIVESASLASSPGQVVEAAAPVMTVSAGDLGGTAPAQPSAPAAHEEISVSSLAAPPAAPVVREVWADDNVTLPSPDRKEGSEATLKPLSEKAGQEAPQQVLKAPAPAQSSAKRAAKGYVIQAGSFASEENANKLSGILGGIARLAVDKVDMNGKTWWRVRVGPFDSKPQADEALEKVRAAGLPDARLVHL